MKKINHSLTQWKSPIFRSLIRLCFLVAVITQISSITAQDSLLQRLQVLDDNEEKLSTLQKIIGANFYNNTELADSCSNVTLTLSKSISTDSVYCGIIDVKSSVKLVKAEYDSVSYYTQKGLDIIGDKYPLLQAKLLHVTALSHYYQGNYEKSLKQNFESLKIRESLDLPNLQILSLSNIAIAYERMKDPDNAILYNEKALNLTPPEDIYSIATINSNMSAIFTTQKRYDEAIEKLISANKGAIALDNKLLIVDTHLGLAKAYNGLDDTRQAIDNAQAAFRLSTSIDNKAKQISSLNIIGGLKMKSKNYEAAISDMTNALKISLDNDIAETRLDVYQNLRDAYAATSNFTGYARMKDSIISIKEKTYRAEKIRTTEELTYKYETAKKDLLIKSNQLNLEKQKNQKKLLLISTILLLLLAASIFAYMKNRIKSNKKLALQESKIQSQRIDQLEKENQILAMSSMIEGQESERKRIAQDLHDGLGGLLATIKVKFGIIQKEIEAIESINVYEQTSSMIDDACSEVRKIAHNMMPDALSKLGLVSAVQDIADYTEAIDIKVIDLGIEKLTETQEIMLYRVIQEFITNTRKHAEASQIIIQLSMDENYANIDLEDNGNGFEVESHQTSGLGLKNMASRINFINGTFEMESKVGIGTTVHIQIPK